MAHKRHPDHFRILRNDARDMWGYTSNKYALITQVSKEVCDSL